MAFSKNFPAEVRTVKNGYAEVVFSSGVEWLPLAGPFGINKPVEVGTKGNIYYQSGATYGVWRFTPETR